MWICKAFPSAAKEVSYDCKQIQTCLNKWYESLATGGTLLPMKTIIQSHWKSYHILREVTHLASLPPSLKRLKEGKHVLPLSWNSSCFAICALCSFTCSPFLSSNRGKWIADIPFIPWNRMSFFGHPAWLQPVSLLLMAALRCPLKPDGEPSCTGFRCPQKYPPGHRGPVCPGDGHTEAVEALLWLCLSQTAWQRQRWDCTELFHTQGQPAGLAVLTHEQKNFCIQALIPLCFMP